VVFRKPPFPATFWGYPVIDRDQSDLRILDPTPCIVALGIPEFLGHHNDY
jgi:hypothetical protein